MQDIDRGARKRSWTALAIPAFSAIRNPHQLVVVLTDGRIASSGEAFLGYLRQLENVVFVGENSSGCGVFGELGQYTLPNSGITIRLGNKLFLPTDLTNTEGKGFMPDLWVPASQASPSALAAIQKGWLKPPQ
jgi:C-terminal processing protease CtpA/Prc